MKKNWQQKSDFGLEILGQIHDLLRVDDTYRLDSDRGFTWWPSDFSQTLWCDPEDANGEFRLHVEMDILKAKGHPEEHEFALAQWMCQASLSALVYDAEKDTFKLHASVIVNTENAEALKRVLLAAASLQIADVTKRATSLAASRHLLLPKSVHPNNGIRLQPHSMVKVEEQFTRPYGEKPCKWTSDAGWKEVVHMFNCVAEHVETDESSYASCEMPWEEHEPIRIELRCDDPHPLFGAGLSANLFVALQAGLGKRAETVFKLNLAERNPTIHFNCLGSWCCHSTDLGFTGFMPNVGYSTNHLAVFARDLITRCRWIQSAHLELFSNKEASVNGYVS